jgi:ribosome-associated protein
MFYITVHLTLPSTEIEVRALRAQGVGGQHVNKAATAIQLRFDINASSLPQPYKERLLQVPDHRITRDGVLTIKAQEYRSQEQNKEAALNRLRALIQSVVVPRKRRRATKPTPGSHTCRLERKAHRGSGKPGGERWRNRSCSREPSHPGVGQSAPISHRRQTPAPSELFTQIEGVLSRCCAACSMLLQLPRIPWGATEWVVASSPERSPPHTGASARRRRTCKS